MTNIHHLYFNKARQEMLSADRMERDLEEAFRRQNEIEMFRTLFSPLGEHTAIPAISWEEVRRQLEDLASNPGTRRMIEPLLQTLQYRATWQTPEMIVRGLILLAGLVLDETFVPADTTESEPEFGETPMP